MLEVRGLNKKFKDFQVLKENNLQAGKGAIYGLIGSNGCGKTTLLKHIVQIYQQDHGEIYYNGKLLEKDDPLFEEFYFVQDDLFFPFGSTLQTLFEYEKLLYRKMSEELFLKLIDYFKVDKNQKLSTMSKGQKKQAAFILAMSANPKVLLLDEIVDGLDAVVRRKFWSVLLDEMNRNEMIIIISSHDLKELDNISDRIGIMHDGTIIKEEQMETIRQSMKRIQFAVDGLYEEVTNESYQVLKNIKIGSVYFTTLKGDMAEFEKDLKEKNEVLLFNELPVNLEEIFITELGGSGYGTEEFNL